MAEELVCKEQSRRQLERGGVRELRPLRLLHPLTKVHALLVVALQQAEQQLPQVGRRLPGDAEEQRAASQSATSRLHRVALF